MSAPKHVMLDLETMSSRNNAAIVQIGACVFNPGTREVGDPLWINIRLGDCRARGFHVDPNTEKWWSQQDPLAIKRLMSEPRQDLPDALDEFDEWYPKGAVVWSHATFDAVITQNAYHELGRKQPWHFRDARDLRTLQSLFAFGGRKIPDGVWDANRGLPHFAPDDAVHQAHIAILQIRGVLGLDK